MSKTTVIALVFLVLIVVVGVLMYQTVSNVRVSMSVTKIVVGFNSPSYAYLNFTVHNGGLLPFSGNYFIQVSYQTHQLYKNVSVNVGGGQSQSVIIAVPLNLSISGIHVSGRGVYDYSFSKDFTDLVLSLQNSFIQGVQGLNPPNLKGGYVQQTQVRYPMYYTFSVFLKNVTYYPNGTKVYALSLEFYPFQNGGIAINGTSTIAFSTTTAPQMKVTLVPGKTVTIPIATTQNQFGLNFTIYEGSLLVGYGFYNVTL
ncbi:MAG: hypothetical protein ACP5HQ_02385 [Thermoprotei archaeon]